MTDSKSGCCGGGAEHKGKPDAASSCCGGEAAPPEAAASSCCGGEATPPEAAASSCCGSGGQGASACGGDAARHASAGPLGRFDAMVGDALAYARAAKAEGRPVVGILCEYTPREVILAAGGVPVCLCGGSAETIPAAEAELPATLCPLIKSTYGYLVQGSNPFLEMADLVVAETTCDGKKKMYELMARRKAMHVLALPQTAEGAAALAAWTDAIRGLIADLETRFGVSITDATLREAIRLMNRERRLRRGLAAMMSLDAPPLTGLELLGLKSLISGIPADLTAYEEILAWLETRPVPADRVQAPRVLLTGVPLAHGAERVLALIEAQGGLVVAMENCSGLKPIVEDVDETGDPVAAIARKYLHLPCSVMTPNQGRFDLLRELAVAYRADCVIDLSWQACLTYDVESARVKPFVEEVLQRPYLRISTDYSPSDSERIAVRVGALFETLQATRRARAATP